MNKLFLLLTDAELVSLHAAVINNKENLRLLKSKGIKDSLIRDIGSGVISSERLDEILSASESLNTKVQDAFAECVGNRE